MFNVGVVCFKSYVIAGALVVIGVIIRAIVGERSAEETVHSAVTGGGNVEAARGMCAAGHQVDAVDNTGRHRESGPVGPVYALPGFQAVKIIAPLTVAGGTKRDGSDGARVHAIVMDLMCLGVLPAFELSVEPVVDRFPGDDTAGAEALRYAKGVRE